MKAVLPSAKPPAEATRAKHRTKKNLKVGEPFGQLTVTGPALPRPSGRKSVSMVPVRCACGTAKLVRLAQLVSGDTVSCGCHRRKLHARLMRQCLRA